MPAPLTAERRCGPTGQIAVTLVSPVAGLAQYPLKTLAERLT